MVLGQKKQSKINKSNNKVFTRSKCDELRSIKKRMESLLKEDKYISQKEFVDKLRQDQDTIDFFTTLSSGDILEPFCEKNNISLKIVTTTLNLHQNFSKLVDEHNDKFINNKMKKEKDYLDNILKDVDPNIKLDDDQRKVVLTDEDYCLVIAGAGAGKTTTVAAKVKYLVEKQNVDPKEILVISFTNKAVQELKDKINKDLDIACPITTFHATGNAILRKNDPERLNIYDNSKLYFLLQDYFKRSILQNESLVNNLILFFASYFDAPYEGNELNNFFNKIAKANYSTLRSDLDEFKQEIIDSRSKKKETINNEVLRSYQEVEIANFLYLNGIDYQYEPIYKYDIEFSRKPYTPDFIIKQDDKEAYIEHFGITQSGKNNMYSEGQLEAYKNAINNKIKLHRAHGTTLIYTFSEYNDHLSLLDHLKEELENKGFELHPRSNKEIMEKLVSSEENRYIRKLLTLICRFITNFKTNGYEHEDFNRMYRSTQNVRTRLFLDICNDCYLEYERYLKENNAVDFEDMINNSAKVLKQVKDMKKKLSFKYIIVDEYQDISQQRFDLTTALSEVTDAKIIAVGDDWQSIYAFSGADISLFTHFKEKMGYGKLLKIVHTYRNSQEVIDIAGNFIQKNEYQISKELLSPKRITDPVIIYTYDRSSKKDNKDRKTGINYALSQAVETAIDQIVAYNKQEHKPMDSSILVLGRFGFDGYSLERTGLFEFHDRGSRLVCLKYPKLKITFMTAHASKGLGYDNVIVINGKNETYGFPSKIEDDPVLNFVTKQDKSIEYAEERRLFYVAMTRTKNRVYFIAPEQNPSEFLLEIQKDYKNVVLKGNWNSEVQDNSFLQKKCPICGYPLQYRYKNSYGLRLYMCTNEPEICSFMTNEYGAGKLSIMKCDSCRDGYLIIKKGSSGYFLGCTNYTSDGKGCGRTIAQSQYYKMFDLTPFVKENKQEKPTSNQKVKYESKTQPVRETTNTINKSSIKKVVYQENDLNEVVYTILNCLEHISEKHFFGTTVLLDVLNGFSSDKTKKYHLETIKEYGSLKTMDRNELFYIINWMIKNKYIYKTSTKYPELHPTAEGRNYSKTITSKKLAYLAKELTSYRSGGK